MDYTKFKVNERLAKGTQIYLLLNMFENEVLPEESVSNVVAIDQENNLIWVIEPPHTKFDIYFRIYFNVDSLMAVSSGGQLHEIDERNGKIINSYMTK